MSHEILFSEQNHLSFITLDRPAALNALTPAMIDVMHGQLSAWERKQSISAIIIQSRHGKAFCAGGDVRWAYERGRVNLEETLRFFRHEYRLNEYLHFYSKPYISLMDGITMGGGVGISLHGSHPIATERFVFAMPETTIGFFPDIGASYLLSRCPEHLGMYAALTSARFDAEQTRALGLIRAVVPSDQLPKLVDAFTEIDVSKKELIDQCISRFDQKQDLNFEAEWQRINQHFSLGSVEEILQSLIDSGTEWGQKEAKNLQSKSPLSLKVTYELIKRAKQTDIKGCMRMELCLVNHFIRGHDFYEGVRALIIDKDKNPRWEPDSLAKVTEAQVNRYFSEGEYDEIRK